MTFPVLNTPSQLRRGATPSLSSSGGVLIKSTPGLKVVRVWVDGMAHVYHDLPERLRPAFLLEAFGELLEWQEKKGLQWAPYEAKAKPPSPEGWHRFGGIWWKGPLQSVWALPRGQARLVAGEDYLNQAGGKVGYRVGSYFLVREQIAEVLVDEPA